MKTGELVTCNNGNDWKFFVYPNFTLNPKYENWDKDKIVHPLRWGSMAVEAPYKTQGNKTSIHMCWKREGCLNMSGSHAHILFYNTCITPLYNLHKLNILLKMW